MFGDAASFAAARRCLRFLVGLVVAASDVPRIISRVIIFDARQRQ